MMTRIHEKSALLRTRLVLGMVLGMGLGTGCGEDFEFGSTREEQERNVTIRGNISSRTPAVGLDSRKLWVFVYTNLVDESPQTYTNYDHWKAARVTGENETFTVSGIQSGDITLVFLLEPNETVADDTITFSGAELQDQIALIEDPDNELDNLRGAHEVQLTDVVITFPDSGSGPPYEPGTATAHTITRSSGS